MSQLRKNLLNSRRKTSLTSLKLNVRYQLLLWETAFTNTTLASASHPQRTLEEPMSMTHSVTSLDGGRSRNQRKCGALFLTQTWRQRSVSNRDTTLSLVQTRSSIQLLNCTGSSCYRQKNSRMQHLQCYSLQQHLHSAAARLGPKALQPFSKCLWEGI